MSKTDMGMSTCYLCEQERETYRDDELFFGKKFCGACFDFLTMKISSVGSKHILDRVKAAQSSAQADGELPCRKCGGEVGHRINCPYGIAFSSVPRR